jgi:hypothetical protein
MSARNPWCRACGNNEGPFRHIDVYLYCEDLQACDGRTAARTRAHLEAMDPDALDRRYAAETLAEVRMAMARGEFEP